MGGKIRVLPPEVARKIAAGEVIERPASVVKELVENSLDAGGRMIRVEVREGGKGMICVMDDGEGMTPGDALIALQRHATSKIYTEGDLEAITTLGFRGEALPSIAAVSQLNLVTRQRDAVSGVKISVQGGEVVAVKECGTPPGTRVEVRDLFYNLPARHKFLKGEQAELAHVIEAITRQALFYHRVGFCLIHDDKVVFDLPAVQDPLARIRGVLGKGVASQLRPIGADNGGVSVQGWASPPGYFRGSPKGIYIYVNGRFVRDRLISHAIAEAYRGILPPRMYPVVILAISLSPSQVDVNCHPSKVEVRFRESDTVYRLVREALAGSAYQREEILSPPAQLREGVATYEAKPRSAAAFGELTPSSWRVVGEIKGTYLVVEGEGGVMIIDQHAAHERLIYDELKGALKAGGYAQQSLLIPELVELKGEEEALLLRHREALARLGLVIEEFGQRCVAVKAIPTFLVGEALRPILEALCEELVHRGVGDTIDAVLDRVCALLACRGAVKGGRRLQLAEIEALIASWFAAGSPPTCPHGRPLCVRWGWGEFTGWFRRS